MYILAVGVWFAIVHVVHDGGSSEMCECDVSHLQSSLSMQLTGFECLSLLWARSKCDDMDVDMTSPRFCSKYDSGFIVWYESP